MLNYKIMIENLFETDTIVHEQGSKPLAEELRPQNMEEIVGQEHLFQKNKILHNISKTKKPVSIILWGPAGCGKTSIARAISQDVNSSFISVSAIFTGVGDLKKIFKQAEIRKKKGESTLLFVDEIHRFNKAQLDAFLPVVENGTITLIGATTENPSFELNSALLSRCQIVILNRLDGKALEKLIQRAEKKLSINLPLTQNAREFLKNITDGDGRYLLNIVEQLASLSPDSKINTKELKNIVQQKGINYDKGGDEHYNLISALHKAVRGSDADAALYWFARMIVGGEDPRFIARRMARMASEDIGLADPQAIDICLSAWQIYERLGSSEGELALAEAIVYLATAPKSNAIYKAYGQALQEAKKTGSLMPPKHILNAPTKLMQEIGYGKNYIYDHDTEHGFSGQNYFPDEMQRVNFYNPPNRGFEREINKRLKYWHKLREKAEK